ncbi:MAG: family 16 glycosylhydrolase [Acidimicrobiia bacterium]|nr:family 16 glycosylhydrolase [Acidimicrobiia bacterium]
MKGLNQRSLKGLATLAVMALITSVLLVTPAMPAAADTAVFDDMEHGDPFANGWFSFNGAVGGGGIAANTADLPPGNGGSFSLETGWGSGGAAGFFGGFGRTNPTDLSGVDHFNFWINPDAGQDYTLEINLQDDDNADGNISSPEDDEFQFNCAVSDSGPCAIAGGGWQLVSIPLAGFFDDNSFLTGGNGTLDATPSNGELINVIVAVISTSGADVTFRTDYWAFDSRVVDNFEGGLPAGSDANGNAVGFFTFQDPASTVTISTTATPPVPVPDSDSSNTVLQVETSVSGSNGFAGVVHAFENESVDTWVTQDWSMFAGFSFWLYGNNTGSTLFVDLLDNRNPGSTTDDAERFSIDVVDDFSGWRLFEIPFASLNRKEVGNGAPNDGLNLTEVHGWAFGVFDSGVPFTNYLDDVQLFGVGEVPELAVSFSANDFDVTEGDTGQITVALSRALGDDDPDRVSIDYSVETIVPVPGRDYVQPAPGTLTFVKDGPSELSFSVQTLEDSKHESAERLILKLSNPVDVAAGFIMQAALTISDDDPFDPLLLDDFEHYPYLWDAAGNVGLANPELESGDPMAVPGQGPYEQVLEATVPLHVDISIEGRVCNRGSGVIPVVLYSTDEFDATTVDHTTVTLGSASETHLNRKTGTAVRHVEDVDRDGDLDLVFHFRFSETGLECDPSVVPFNGHTYDDKPFTGGGSDASFGRDFPVGQDWTGAEALSFWYYGQNTGDTITLDLLDNRASDPGPAGWSLVWSDEFNEPAGTPPNPDNWGYEIGDGTVNGIPGWGNSELQYYTDDPDNVATDGAGNLVITADAADGQDCYYGPCEYTSARLATTNRAEFAYGRVESRIQVPDGENGLWPAFWSLGTDIDRVDWPQTGEIDIMEYVSRLPDEIFGTIHGPGYSGGSSFGNTYPFPGGVAAGYHTFAIEWQPDLIEWYVDGIVYHTATPADVAPNQWVFNDPVYLLLNLAVGGNFGGEVSDALTFPQELKVDYVRVYQGPDTAERFETSFVDDFSGWQQVVVPFDAFVRSAAQPNGAPDDGLSLNEVWGYGFDLPDAGSSTGTLWLDQVRLVPEPRLVTNLNDAGPGSLRQAIADVVAGGNVVFDPSLAGGTITLSSGPLVIGKAVSIDGSGAAGIVVSGGGADRVLIVGPGGVGNIGHLTLADGYGWQLAGCVLNNGSLTLDHATVTGCTMATDAGEFWQGGGGIYNGDGATLSLVDSTVADNHAAWSGGGVYSFLNTTTTIVRSTINGNVSNDVGGAFRSLGNVTITNSTISGNTAIGWHGGAIFQTDGDVSISNSTVANNVGPDWAPSTFFIGQYGGGFVPTLTLTNTIVTGNQWYACEKFASGTPGNVVSGGSNLVQDDSCNPVGSDLIGVDALISPLADNGGPTFTHALLPGSPAIDAANASACPATDQRGVTRPQGAGCDVGAFELE